MVYTYKVLLKDLKKDHFKPCYWLCGDEPFYIDQIGNYIEKHALKEEEKSLNLHVRYGNEENLTRIIELALQFPMSTKRKVIIIKEAQELLDIQKKNMQKLLIAYLTKPLTSTILVFEYKHKKVPISLQKALKEHTAFLQTKKIYDSRLSEWIIQYGKEQDIVITNEAARILCEFVGNDLSRMANELEKLFLRKQSDETKILPETVIENIGISREYNIFELQKAIAEKNPLKIYPILLFFERNSKDHPAIPIIAFLFGFFSRLLLLYEYKRKSHPQFRIISGLNPKNAFQMRDYVTAQKKYTFSHILTIIAFLHRADLQIKGIYSVAKPYQILKELMYRILHA